MNEHRRERALDFLSTVERLGDVSFRGEHAVRVFIEIENRLEMLEERYSEEAYEAGFSRGRSEVDVEAMIGGALDVIEERVGRVFFDREALDEALAKVNASGRRGTLQPRKLLPGSVEKPSDPPPYAVGDLVVEPWGKTTREIAVVRRSEANGAWVVDFTGGGSMEASMVKPVVAGDGAGPVAVLDALAGTVDKEDA